MRIAIGSDTACHLTEVIAGYLQSQGHVLTPLGALQGETCDYIDSARAVAEHVADGIADAGVLFCNTGTGATMIANKIPGARAALCVDAYSASIAKLANNANILVLGIRLTGEKLALEITETWLGTEPSAEPRRVAFHRKTDALERQLAGAAV